MAISMFSSQVSPIAIDFGTSSVKLLQIGPGPRPVIVAAAELSIPDEARGDQQARMDYLADALPKAIRKGRFKGKRVTCSIPSSQTFVTHLRVPTSGSNSGDEFVQMQLHALTGIPPANMVIRTFETKDVHSDHGMLRETICFAVPREVVMRQIDLLKRCKLEVAGVHTEQHAIVWAFNHIHMRKDDDRTTNLLVDIGWGGSKAGISHGNELVFAKTIQIGGRFFDQVIADAMDCDLPTARARRTAAADTVPARARSRQTTTTTQSAGQASESGANTEASPDDGYVATAPDRRAGGVPSSLHPASGTAGHFGPPDANFDELVETLVDELLMCTRYHRSLYEERAIDRVIFVGGESRQIDLCRQIAARLGLPSHVGDPLDRLQPGESGSNQFVRTGKAMPGWAVVSGLCCGSATE